MSLNKAQLKTDIEKLLEDMMQKEEKSFSEFAKRLSTSIDTYIKAATITVAPGIPVSTAGTATAQTGTTTSTGTGTIS